MATPSFDPSRVRIIVTESTTVPGFDLSRVRIQQGGVLMPWPSRRDKIFRSVVALLERIDPANTTPKGNAYQLSPTLYQRRVDYDTMTNNVPCVCVFSGDEAPTEEGIGHDELTWEITIEGWTRHKTEPQRELERLLEDVKDALYPYSDMDDPDVPGEKLGCRFESLTVFTDDGEYHAEGFAAFLATLRVAYHDTAWNQR